MLLIFFVFFFVLGQNAKKHLSERLKKTDDKLESQKDLLKGLQDDVRVLL